MYKLILFAIESGNRFELFLLLSFFFLWWFITHAAIKPTNRIYYMSFLKISFRLDGENFHRCMERQTWHRCRRSK